MSTAPDPPTTTATSSRPTTRTAGMIAGGGGLATLLLFTVATSAVSITDGPGQSAFTIGLPLAMFIALVIATLASSAGKRRTAWWFFAPAELLVIIMTTWLVDELAAHSWYSPELELAVWAVPTVLITIGWLVLRGRSTVSYLALITLPATLIGTYWLLVWVRVGVLTYISVAFHWTLFEAVWIGTTSLLVLLPVIVAAWAAALPVFNRDQQRVPQDPQT